MDDKNINGNVIHPEHYNNGKMEVWDFIKEQNLNFFLGNAIKYICRAGKKRKDTYVEDLQKAINYLDKEILNYFGGDSSWEDQEKTVDNHKTL